MEVDGLAHLAHDLGAHRVDPHQELLKKVVEEAGGLARSRSREDFLREYADLMVVLDALTATLGFLLSVLATLGATVAIFQEGTFGIFEGQPLVSFIPLFLIGVFLVFWLTKASFTREAYVGVIMMSGIVVNSAILLVDHVNQLRRYHGLGIEDALVRGASERQWFRPNPPLPKVRTRPTDRPATAAG